MLFSRCLLVEVLGQFLSLVYDQTFPLRFKLWGDVLNKSSLFQRKKDPAWLSLCVGGRERETNLRALECFPKRTENKNLLKRPFLPQNYFFKEISLKSWVFVFASKLVNIIHVLSDISVSTILRQPWIIKSFKEKLYPHFWNWTRLIILQVPQMQSEKSNFVTQGKVWDAISWHKSMSGNLFSWKIRRVNNISRENVSSAWVTSVDNIHNIWEVGSMLVVIALVLGWQQYCLKLFYNFHVARLFRYNNYWCMVAVRKDIILNVTTLQ